MQKFVWLVACAVAFTAAALAPSSAASGDLMYTHPGRLIDIGGRNINMYCMGSGTPAVVFDAGFEDWSPAWATIQPAVAAWTQACSYDRAGSGFSDPGPLPRSSLNIAQDLYAALQKANIKGPYVLVGHSFGSFNTRMFADQHMSDVAGLVLVDASDYDLLTATPAEVAADHAHIAAIASGLQACGGAVAHYRPLPTMPPRPNSPAVECNRQFFRGLPEKMFSAQLNAQLLKEVLKSDRQYVASASEIQNLAPDGETMTYLRMERRSFGNRPVRILTALNHNYDTPETPADVRKKDAAEERVHQQTQALFLSLSTDSKQLLAPESGHYIQFDDPALVLGAIHDVVERSRARS
jgi:pimeloyl-ACP methyl ester carboxylesterase